MGGWRGGEGIRWFTEQPFDGDSKNRYAVSDTQGQDNGSNSGVMIELREPITGKTTKPRRFVEISSNPV